MAIGTYQREYPQGFCMRNYDPQGPSTLSISLPVTRDTVTRMPHRVLKGMIISPNEAGTAWDLGVPETKKAPAVVAFADGDATFYDSIAADKLVGLSCSGKFRFATPFFMRQAATGTIENPTPSGDAYMYKLGTRLTYAKNDEIDIYTVRRDGKVVSVGRSAAGFIRPAAAGEPVIGVVAESHTGVNGSADLTATQNGAWALRQDVGTAVDSTSFIENAYFVVWDTTFSPDVVMA